MRDVVLTAIILGSIPFILRNPVVGLLMWVWVGIMNPHRFTWGFSYSLPFAQIIAIAFIIGLVVNYNKLQKVELNRALFFLILFMIWICVSPLFSFHPEQELERWLKVFKVLFMCLLGLLVVGNRDQLLKLVLVLTLSVGFFGIKGGFFTLVHGGNFRVWGPPGSFFYDNNALALTTIMILPFLRYFQLYWNNVWLKRCFFLSMVLCLISALGSHSRGALLAMLCMGLFFAMKSRGRVLSFTLIVFTVIITPFVMPDAWFDRMATITEYQQDGSAMGRINAWHMAWNLAVDRFPIGGGFGVYKPDVCMIYAPNPLDCRASHSIYFQVLVEHGFVGLMLFLLVFLSTWFDASRIIKDTKNQPEFLWAKDLAAMTQVSLVGYATGGAFLSLAYFDLPYYLVLTMAVLKVMVRKKSEVSNFRDKLVKA